MPFNGQHHGATNRRRQSESVLEVREAFSSCCPVKGIEGRERMIESHEIVPSWKILPINLVLPDR